MESERNRRQTSGPTKRNHIESQRQLDEFAHQSKVLAAKDCLEYMWRVDGGKDSVLTRGDLPVTSVTPITQVAKPG